MKHVTTGADAQKNFLIVDGKTETSAIETAFDKFIERKDIGIILINQHVRRAHVFFSRRRFTGLAKKEIRLPIEYDIAWTLTQRLSLPSSKSQAKTTPTIPRRTVC